MFVHYELCRNSMHFQNPGFAKRGRFWKPLLLQYVPLYLADRGRSKQAWSSVNVSLKLVVELFVCTVQQTNMNLITEIDLS